MEKGPKKIKEFDVVKLDSSGKESKKTYLLVEPTAKQVRDSKWHYSVVYCQALREGLLTERQMAELLRQGKGLSEEDTSELASLYLQAQVVSSELEETKDILARQNLAFELKSLRQRIANKEEGIRAPYYHSAEQSAEESRVDFLLQFVVRDSSDPNTMVWQTKQDYEAETDLQLVDTAKTHFLFWMHNLDEDWEKKLPENIALQEINETLLSSPISGEEEVGAAPETDLEEEKKSPSEKPAKKRGRKKKKAEG